MLPAAAQKQVAATTASNGIPASRSTDGFTKTIYAMVTKVVTPARASVRQVAPKRANSKYCSSRWRISGHSSWPWYFLEVYELNVSGTAADGTLEAACKSQSASCGSPSSVSIDVKSGEAALLASFSLRAHTPNWDTVLEDEAQASTILIVDDLELNRRLVKAMLKAGSYRILEARRPSEAFAILDHEKVDLLV